MTIDEAIQTLIAIERYPTSIKGKDCACEMAIKALEEKREREANEPLTIEQLNGMIGCPVYTIENNKYSNVYILSSVDCYEDLYIFFFKDRQYGLSSKNYGTTWLSYKYPPAITNEANV